MLDPEVIALLHEIEDRARPVLAIDYERCPDVGHRRRRNVGRKRQDRRGIGGRRAANAADLGVFRRHARSFAPLPLPDCAFT
jgi:hypothetical protein